MKGQPGTGRTSSRRAHFLLTPLGISRGYLTSQSVSESESFHSFANTLSERDNIGNKNDNNAETIILKRGRSTPTNGAIILRNSGTRGRAVSFLFYFDVFFFVFFCSAGSFDMASVISEGHPALRILQVGPCNGSPRVHVYVHQASFEGRGKLKMSLCDLRRPTGRPLS